MSQTWEELLQEGSYGGVRFDFVSVRDEGGNDLDRQRLPNKGGARILPRTARERTWEIMAIFVDDDYPDTMNQLLAQLADGGKVKKFVHPIDGEVNAACDRWTRVHDAEDAVDCASIQMTLVEDNDSDVSPSANKDTTPARANEVRSLGDSVLVALAAFQDILDVKNSEIGLAVQGAVNAASAVADSLEADFDSLSTLEVQAKANVALAASDSAIALLADYSTTEEYELGASIQQMAAAVRNLAQDLIDQRPPLSEYMVPADTNLLSLAHDMGADADELLALNSFADPSLIPAGSKVQAYAS